MADDFDVPRYWPRLVENNDMAEIKRAIGQGANIDEKDKKDGWTALIITAYHGHDECMKLLLSKGANVDLVTNVLSYSTYQDGDTALSWSARFDKIKCLRLLLEHGADMNMCNNDGWTALIMAAAKNHAKCVDLLLAKGANINLVTKVLIANGFDAGCNI